MSKPITESEMAAVHVLLEHGPCSISQLQDRMKITANAVRQRLVRLLAAGLIDRTTHSEGRGRPNHLYELTASGRKLAGHNLADFSGALWHEIQLIADKSIRQSVLDGVVRRMAESYAVQIAGGSFEERLEAVARLFGERDVPVTIETTGGHPVLKILTCPYPDLVNDNHEVCEIERQLFSRVTGEDLELCQCRQDGDSVCCFQIEDHTTGISSVERSRS